MGENWSSIAGLTCGRHSKLMIFPWDYQILFGCLSWIRSLCCYTDERDWLFFCSRLIFSSWSREPASVLDRWRWINVPGTHQRGKRTPFSSHYFMRSFVEVCRRIFHSSLSELFSTASSSATSMLNSIVSDQLQKNIEKYFVVESLDIQSALHLSNWELHGSAKLISKPFEIEQLLSLPLPVSVRVEINQFSVVVPTVGLFTGASPLGVELAGVTIILRIDLSSSKVRLLQFILFYCFGVSLSDWGSSFSSRSSTEKEDAWTAWARIVWSEFTEKWRYIRHVRTQSDREVDRASEREAGAFRCICGVLLWRISGLLVF